MARKRLGTQGDLFASDTGQPESDVSGMTEPMPEDFIQRIRSELNATLAMVRAAQGLPWPNLTQATLAELRMHSVSNWLPKDEAAELCRAFDVEMKRIYILIGEWAPDEPADESDQGVP